MWLRPRKELEESDTASRLARSASEIERGRGVQAASRDGLITEGLEQLQQKLEEAASWRDRARAASDDGQRDAEPGDLLAELADCAARWNVRGAQGLAQEGRSQGEAGTQSPMRAMARPGRTGASGQQGQGEGGSAARVAISPAARAAQWRRRWWRR